MDALGGNATFHFNDTMSTKIWIQQNQGKVDWDEKGTTFTVNRRGDSPMVQSKFYMLFGRLEIIMQAAPGQGIVSSAILQSETLDELDWEWLVRALFAFFNLHLEMPCLASTNVHCLTGHQQYTCFDKLLWQG